MKNSFVMRNRTLLFFDILGSAVLYLLSILFLFGLSKGTVNIVRFLPVWFAVLVSLSSVFYFAGLYKVLWSYASTRDYVKLMVCAVTGMCISLCLTLVFKYITPTDFSSNMRRGLRICFLCSSSLSIFCIFIRMFLRALSKLPAYHDASSDDSKKTKVLIVGAGAAASMVIRDNYTNDNLNFKIIGFVDDNPSKRSSTLGGYPVLGDRYDIPSLCRKFMVDELLLAIPSASSADKNEIIEICTKTKAKIKIVPALDQAISSRGNVEVGKVRSVRIEDLLDRQPVVLDNEEISEYIQDKVVMVTGGGGSIGSELCRQIMKYKPRNLVVVDIYENNAYDLQMELNRHYPDNPPTVLIASVRDRERLSDIFREYKPYIVFHAAAHKHVPLMEQSPGEAIKNNVFGTLNVAMCADKYEVRRFVMISTDKAVNPTNIMGATKRMCEMIVQSMQKISSTEFVAVRFGNVLGSNGSVIPLFKKQIEEGGPVTVTHKDITRFFMTIPEAAQLVLQAASYARGGEIFVLDMGKPVRIYDLAKNIIRLSGYTPDVDIKIEVTGLRPGEKLFEELLMNEEGLTKTRHEKIFIGAPSDITMEELKPSLDMLMKAADSNDITAIKDIMEAVVPTYIRNPEVINRTVAHSKS